MKFSTKNNTGVYIKNQNEATIIFSTLFIFIMATPSISNDQIITSRLWSLFCTI